MSEIKVDTLTGKTTANDITVTVGASVTQSLEQGLAKSWASIDQTSTDHPVYDSFNVSATADVTAGTTKVSFTNAFSNANYSLAGVGQTRDHSGANFGLWGKSTVSSRQMTTADFHTRNVSSSGVDTDITYFGFAVHGDLA
jgi:hypothetical protein